MWLTFLFLATANGVVLALSIGPQQHCSGPGDHSFLLLFFIFYLIIFLFLLASDHIRPIRERSWALRLRHHQKAFTARPHPHFHWSAWTYFGSVSRRLVGDSINSLAGIWCHCSLINKPRCYSYHLYKPCNCKLISILILTDSTTKFCI